jgi:hypothetical protein
VPERIWQKRQAWSEMPLRRGSTTMSFVPFRAASLKKVAATGWLAVVFVPVMSATSEFWTSP